jgi:HAMP domain-containing protein
LEESQAERKRLQSELDAASARASTPTPIVEEADPVELKELNRELEDLRAQLQKATDDAQYWSAQFVNKEDQVRAHARCPVLVLPCE